MKTNYLLIFSVLWILMAFSCKTSEQHVVGESSVSYTLATLIGRANLNLIRHSQTLQLTKIESFPTQDITGVELMHGFRVIQSAVLDEKSKDQIINLVGADSTYEIDSVYKTCIFTPSYALTFQKGADSLDVLINFDCNQVKFLFNDTSIIEDIDPGREKLWKLVLQVLPDQPEGSLPSDTLRRDSSSMLEVPDKDTNIDSDDLLKALLGNSIYNQISQTQQARAYSLENFLLKEGQKDSTGVFAGFPIKTQKVLDSVQSAEVVKLLCQPKNYVLTDDYKSGTFAPDFGFSLGQENEKLDVLISLRCRIIRFDHQGESVFGGIDPGMLPLTKLARHLFPEETRFQHS
ncbi:MAG: hypothetical protein AAF632_28930 [Bacteroidota bacterium]